MKKKFLLFRLFQWNKGLFFVVLSLLACSKGEPQLESSSAYYQQVNLEPPIILEIKIKKPNTHEQIIHYYTLNDRQNCIFEKGTLKNDFFLIKRKDTNAQNTNLQGTVEYKNDFLFLNTFNIDEGKEVEGDKLVFKKTELKEAEKILYKNWGYCEEKTQNNSEESLHRRSIG